MLATTGLPLKSAISDWIQALFGAEYLDQPFQQKSIEKLTFVVGEGWCKQGHPQLEFQLIEQESAII